jgi:hypothetical protein
LTSRVEELAARRRLLRAQSAVERETLRLDAEVIGNTLSTVDRAVAIVQRLRRSPLILTAAVVGVIVFRRHPATAWVMRGIAVAGTARRVGAALRRIAAEPVPQEGEGR